MPSRPRRRASARSPAPTAWPTRTLVALAMPSANENVKLDEVERDRVRGRRHLAEVRARARSRRRRCRPRRTAGRRPARRSARSATMSARVDGGARRRRRRARGPRPTYTTSVTIWTIVVATPAPITPSAGMPSAGTPKISSEVERRVDDVAGDHRDRPAAASCRAPRGSERSATVMQERHDAERAHVDVARASCDDVGLDVGERRAASGDASTTSVASEPDEHREPHAGADRAPRVVVRGRRRAPAARPCRGPSRCRGRSQ